VKLLLDTVTFLRASLGEAGLSSRARHLLLDDNNERYLSTVSAWEITIKYSLGSLPLPQPPDRFIPRHRDALAAQSLPLDEESALHLARLPQLHRDPFDRMLICQAIIGGMILVTPDELISQYPVHSAW
jgi:PIN domain nuclease of toxin-antitoxin system